MKSTKFNIRLASKKDIRSIASIHQSTIHQGFLSSLGIKLLQRIYSCLVADSNAVVYVAEYEGEIIGFSSACLDISETYKKMITPKNLLQFMYYLLPQFIRIDFYRKVVQTLFYPRRKELQDLPPSESLATGVKPEYTQYGISYYLLKEIIRWFSEKKIACFKAMVYEGYKNNDVVKILGFKHITTIVHHNHKENIYIYNIDNNESHPPQ